MKIVDIETFVVAPRWLFCRIATDEGIVGWGEPIVEGRAETLRAAVHELADYLIGQDPLRIEDHWQVLSKGGFYRGGPILSSAVAGIDQALWDIAGKVYAAPVHALLGGHVRDRVRVYTWVGGDEPTEIGEAINAKIDQGFTAVKMNASAVMSRLGAKADADWWDSDRWDGELAADLFRLSAMVSEQVGKATLGDLGVEPDEYDVDRTLAFLKAVSERIAGSVNAATYAQILKALDEAEEPTAPAEHVFEEAESSRDQQ
jgi:L-alanine-DL-glutamate epimerase-like enolase superfamily enzyme